MKVSVNWLSEYLNFELPPTAELVERIGTQLGGVEAVVDLTAQYTGVVVVKVVECTPLENSDRLSLCFVDDDGVVQEVDRRSDGLVQVVCGAPNVKAGQTVAWLPPSTTVPSTFNTDPLVLEARELRGTVSNGMLASAKELALGDSHAGLLILEDDLKPGTSFAQAFKLGDQIIDIENKMFTHRPDCFGQLGVAREVAGVLGQPFTSPDWYWGAKVVTAGEGLSLQVRNEVPNDVPRFMAVPLQNVTVGPSPVWLQSYLSRVGVRPINNVVDLTNYIMLLTGQPTHAYDYDKVAALSDGDGATIVVRYPREGETIELLSGKTITPRSEAVMIATDQQAIGVGGVMGGGNTEVEASTKNVILECANFDMYSIRRTSMAHGLFTDAVTRFNKGQSPLQNPSVLAKLVNMLKELAGGDVAGEVIDIYEDLIGQGAVPVDASFINARLGLDLSPQDMAKLLTNVEFKVDIAATESLVVEVPFWRTDIAIPEDIVEEVGRLHGFDKLRLELPQRDITPAPQDALMSLKTAIRQSLTGAGANELLTYSFVPGAMLDKAAQKRKQAYKVSNALSPDLEYYRLTALPSLLDKVHQNIKAGYDEFALFELGKGHDKSVELGKEGVPIEFEDLDFVYASKSPQTGAAFYRARRCLDALAADLGLSFSYRPFDEDPHDPVTDPYDVARLAEVRVGETPIGVVGELKASVRKNFKLPTYCAGFTISPKQLLKAERSRTYQPLPRFPKIEQDICLRVNADLLYADLEQFVQTTFDQQKPEHARLQLKPLDIYQRENDAEHKQVTFRVALASFEKTMTDQEMNQLLDQVASAAAERFNAERV